MRDLSQNSGQEAGWGRGAHALHGHLLLNKCQKGSVYTLPCPHELGDSVHCEVCPVPNGVVKPVISFCSGAELLLHLSVNDNV